MITIMASKKSKKNNEFSLLDKFKALSRIRKSLMNNQVAKEICKENGFDDWFLESVPIRWEDIDVAAKTTNGSISLNPKLLDKPFDVQERYVIHEIVHAIQHIKDYGKDNDDKDEEYLDRDDEIEAFQRQIEYDSKTRGLDKAEEYVDDLIEYHDIPKSDRDDKKEELMELAQTS